MLSSPEYLPYLIKDYKYWELFIHDLQVPYLGRAIAWWKDRSPGEGEGMRPSDLPPEALLELNHTIFEDLLDAYRSLGYKVDPYKEHFLLNMDYLANNLGHNHHLHWHFVPRSRDIIFFEKRPTLTIHNENWGFNWSPYQTEPPSPEKNEAVRNLMAKAIGGIVRP